MDIRNIVRVGIISTVNIETCSARVTFLDKQDTVSADLAVLNRGSMIVKDYWLPDIGEQVLCLFLGNGKNQGFILGSFFSSVDKPSSSGMGKRIVDFGDGSVVEYEKGSITINSSKAVNIVAPTGDVVVNGISLVNHIHPESIGSVTGKPQ